MSTGKYDAPYFTGEPLWELRKKVHDPTRSETVYVRGRLVVFYKDSQEGHAVLETPEGLLISNGCFSHIDPKSECNETGKVVESGYKLIPADEMQRLCQTKSKKIQV